MDKLTYKNGVMQPTNMIDDEALYPRHTECPRCWFNLRRHKMRIGVDPRAFVAECTDCGSDLVGW